MPFFAPKTTPKFRTPNKICRKKEGKKESVPKTTPRFRTPKQKARK